MGAPWSPLVALLLVLRPFGGVASFIEPPHVDESAPDRITDDSARIKAQVGTPRNPAYLCPGPVLRLDLCTGRMRRVLMLQTQHHELQT